MISEINVQLIKSQSGLIGFASLIFQKKIYLSGIGIYQKLNGLGYRLTYPQKSNFTLFHPINRKMSDLIEEAVFEKLNDVMKKVNENDRYNKTKYTTSRL
ncbi:MAG: septation protein SpoVG family protein [Alphaproteobacteria bacterium]|nr:septation protein SpoVG family protein [Alphaproteobacteria bacterium]